MVPIQFEYGFDNWCYIGDNDRGPKYQNRPIKHFVTVISAFVHHYSGELMYKIRDEWISPSDGYPVSEEKIMSEAAVLELVNNFRIRVEE